MKKAKRRTRPQQTGSDVAAGAAEPIAVIGMSCRFAGGADSPEALWRLLIEETDAIADEPPPGRWSGDHRGSDRAGAGKTVSVAGGYLADVTGFDAEFFGITPREAADMDPQQRLALELAWEAFEDAAVRPDRVRHTGVYFANKFNDYRAVKLSRGATAVTPFTSTGDVEGVIANRVSYFLGFDGPSMTVNASCAGSLVAVHLACQALRAGESALAVAGGVQLNLIPETAIALSALGVLSAHGRSRTFDASADGYARGEGGAVVVLKPLRQALRDGDRVYCTLLGSATNNNGRHHSMPASSADGQRQLIRRACAQAGVHPRTIDYVEAHGTGTAVGDRAELSALADVYGTGRAPEAPLTVGSIKTNIGHTEAAAGLAGLVKVALALSHRRIPRSLHFQRAPEHFDPASAGVRIADTALPWPQHDGPARAAVSAFGFGGSNAHVIVEGAPPADRLSATDPAERLVVLSARTETALRAHAYQLREHLASHPGLPLGDLAHTLASRMPLRHRLSMVADEVDQVVEFLGRYLDGTAPEHSGDAENEALSLVLSEALRPGSVVRRDLLAAAGMLFERGVDPDWAAVNPPGRPITLPTYPFQRERHWAVPRTPVAVDGIATAESAPEFALSESAVPSGHPLPSHAPSAQTTSPALTPAGPSAHPHVPAGTAGASVRSSASTDPAESSAHAAAPTGAATSVVRSSASPSPATTPVERSARTSAPAAAAAGGSATQLRATEPPEAFHEPEDAAGPDAVVLAALVTGELAEVVGISPDRVAVRQNFDQLGIGSVHAVELSARLSARLGIDVPAAIVWGCPTVELLAAELAVRLAPEHHSVRTADLPTASSTAGPPPVRDIDQPGTSPADRTIATSAVDSTAAAEDEALSTEELLALSRELLG
ncbi:beta-ketoacyl synthase N-terminal-like domain-containing protein [Nocardia asiatica]|uniref:beta-ketoacyl synthase N-terminal-like domain-containing protein n=1 Tax=Nocardia asiatica TaxID=209252 RepID=UPI00245708AE|nr:beta-ketoacyl synthase N-terminal-like domain-containing protein [Nocardia asiatica]